MFCSLCSTKNPEDSANCYNCGQKMATELKKGDPNPNLITKHQLAKEIEEATQKMSPKELAELRISLRKRYGLPAQPEPLLDGNSEAEEG